jgi:hypothetical protein
MLECRSGRRRSVEDHLVNDPDRVPVSGSWDRAVFAFIVRLLGDGLRALPDDGVNGGTAKAGCSGDLRHPGSFRVHSLGHGLLLGFNDDAFSEPVALLPAQCDAPGFGNSEPKTDYSTGSKVSGCVYRFVFTVYSPGNR